MLAHNLQGKGIWIRRVSECENGDIARIVERTRAAGYTHVLVKTCDGDDSYNVNSAGRDFAAEIIPRLREGGIGVWAWHYVYGDPPPFKDTEKTRYWELEAAQAVRRCRALMAMGLQGYVIDAEGEYERIPDRVNKATAFCQILRAGLPDLPIALASWKFPSFHAGFPWAAFRQHVDLDLPQVYWISAHNPAQQLQQSRDEFAAMNPRLPYVPAGPSFFEHNWRPTPAELTAFFQKAVDLGLPAASLWDYDFHARRGGESYNPDNLNFTAEWDAAGAFAWPGVVIPGPGDGDGGDGPPLPPPADPIERFFFALTNNSLDLLMALYAPDPAHINATRVERNPARIRDFYAGMLAALGAPRFEIRNVQEFSSSKRVSWTGHKADGTTLDGEDTINLSPEGKIRYHTTTFNLARP